MRAAVWIEFNGEILEFEKNDRLFSPGALDAGTRAMLKRAPFAPGMKVLDLGCGWGAVGLFAARKCGAEGIWMTDIDPEAVSAARANAEANDLAAVHILLSDGFRSLDETGFDLILSNPPYHADFAVPKHFIEKGFNRLALGGRLMMVTKRREWYKNKLAQVFGGVRVEEEDGYFIFTAQKRSMRYARKGRGEK